MLFFPPRSSCKTVRLLFQCCTVRTLRARIGTRSKTALSSPFKTTSGTCSGGGGENVFTCSVDFSVIASEKPADKQGIRISCISLYEKLFRKMYILIFVIPQNLSCVSPGVKNYTYIYYIIILTETERHPYIYIYISYAARPIIPRRPSLFIYGFQK